MTTAISGALGHFQDCFARALLDPALAQAGVASPLAAQPGFAVYRNTVMKGCIDALQANYPAVARLVGEEWFRAAAAVYVREAPPTEATLHCYGASFPDFLQRFEPAGELPYLPGVARLDRYWTEAHAAADDDALDPDVLARLAPDILARTVLRPHAAARWAWFERAPTYAIWSSNRGDASAPADFEWRSEGALVARPRDVVVWCALDTSEIAFLDTCAAGATLGHAAQAALAARPDVDLKILMSGLLEHGAFSRMTFEANLHCRRGSP